MKEKLNKFSVPLGLLDYINPIFYCITMITIINNMFPRMESPYRIILLVGAIISIFFGFIIPTGKVLVGLGVIKFRMPVSLVFCVNSGILLTGLMLSKRIMNYNLIILIILIILILIALLSIYRKSKKFNTVAVLTGAFGYLLLYVSLITLSIMREKVIPCVLYGLAILLFLLLCRIGIKGNLKDPRVHWVIETCNVVCQGLVALSTFLVFR